MAIGSPVVAGEKVYNQNCVADKVRVSRNDTTALPCTLDMTTGMSGNSTDDQTSLPPASGVATTTVTDQGGGESGKTEDALVEVALS